MTTDPLVRDLSEDQLLARILPVLSAPHAALIGPGDDAAVVAAADGRFVVTTDVLVEDRHFRTRWSNGDDIGWRAAVQNLADVVAMGARPTTLVVCLVIPDGQPVALVEGIARGLAEACATVGAGVVGGDLSSGEHLVIAVTAHGDLAGRAPVLRSGARVGDVVALAGVTGRSAAGLALLDASVVVLPRAGSVPPGPAGDLVRAYLRPAPPLAANTDGATAMLDVSDGLVRDAARIAAASGVSIDLAGAAFADDIEALVPAATAIGADPRTTAASWVLSGGEDHALLATFPPGLPLPAPFRAVGTVIAGNGGEVLVDGAVPAVPTSGWDHFAGR